jgi:hypothetical protein
MTQEQLRMQMLAGIITEGQYKAKLNENEEFNSWKEKLYGIVMNDANLDREDIAIDELEIKKYWEEGKTPEEVYYDVWLQDAGNFRAI